jgi:hypothetical protein
MHVETGMALAAGVPVLVAPEAKVCEGVFAPDVWTDALRGTSADTPDLDVIDEWAAAVAERSAARSVLSARATRLGATSRDTDGGLGRDERPSRRFELPE